jgi:hypothetical protein
MSEATQTTTATVSEDKFNATATLVVTADDKRMAKTAARQFFEEKHGSSPSKVIAEEREHAGLFNDDGLEFEVMVSDHSSGSLTDGEEYEF